MGLATIAAVARSVGSDVKLLDAVALGMTGPSALKHVQAFDPNWIVASLSTPTMESDLTFLAQAKSVSNCKTAVFGAHVSHAAAELLLHPGIDVAIRHDPEPCIPYLIQDKVSEAPNATWKREDDIVKNETVWMDLDFLPVPAWDLVDLSPYRIPIRQSPYVLVATGRGCPHRCCFCVVPQHYGRHPRLRSVPHVLKELESVQDRVKDVFFHTDTFTLRSDYVTDLCQGIRDSRLDLRWVCNSRVDTLDEKLANIMKDAGCWMVSFGLESGVQEVLAAANKSITPDQSRAAVRAAKAAGLLTVGHFVLGLPGETEETLRKTLHFSRTVGIDFAEFYLATPFPGSALYETFQEKLGKDWHAYRYDNSLLRQDLPLNRARKMGYLRFYLRPTHMAKLMAVFGITSLPRLFGAGLRFLKGTMS